MDHTNEVENINNNLSTAIALFDRSNDQCEAIAFERLNTVVTDRRIKPDVIIQEICKAHGLLELVFAGELPC
jgi:hypothetical protein